VTLSDIHDRIEKGETQELRLIVRGDVDGSVQALSDSLMRLSNDEVEVVVMLHGVGAITESDILLAAASDAIVIGFQVRPNPRAREVAAQEQVDIRLFRVIYEAVDAVKTALSGMLLPEITEEVRGLAEVRDTFRIPRVGTVAGCYVTSGAIERSSQIRVLRDNVVVHEGVIGSLRRFREDVPSVNVGFECGIDVAGFDDVEVGDVLEAFATIETERSIE
jgi:translation initiation factor IF-2